MHTYSIRKAGLRQEGNMKILKIILDAVLTVALIIVLAALCMSLKELFLTARAVEIDEPQAVGTLRIPAVLREREQEPVKLTPQVDNERRLQLKLARWESRRNAEPETEPYTDEELELLACTIYCEAGSDSISDDTRRMVGEVVLNRVADERYPDTIEKVLTQRGQYGRFCWTGVVWPSRASRAAEAHAVERAYDCAKLVFTEERLLPEDVIYQAAHVQGEIVASAPGFYFCR